MRQNVVGNNPDASEFDKTDPHQNLSDFLKGVRKLVDEGRGDKISELVNGHAGNVAADLTKSILQSRDDPWISAMHKVIDTADAGDLAGALAIIDAEKEAGRLDLKMELLLRKNAYDRIGDLAMQLRAIEELDKASGGIHYASSADLLYRLGRYDEMADLCNRWQDSYADRTELYISRARLMYVKGDTAGAQRHIRAILKLDGHAPNAHELAGDILADEGDLRGAVMRYNNALDQEYNMIHYHVRKAEALVKMGRPDAAALACRRGLEIRPQNKRLKAILAESQGLSPSTLR